ncbi:MAG: DNA-3-methyladenine glycosylase [Myxococcales bacterium]|nr:DNA-3-methyladenine glycosylase [Myxococcales bacterium]
MRLGLDYYERPALQVAPELLGKVLIVQEGKSRRAGRIVEVEAYVGEHDLACHASKGRTPRAEVLFGPAGRAYVYFIYGMHYCFNVVTDPEGVASAVLVRALEPLEGIPPSLRTDGPGKLCRAMGIDLSFNRADLRGDRIHLLDMPPLPSRSVAKGRRIGVDYAGKWARKPYRFWVRESRYVSRSPAVSQA